MPAAMNKYDHYFSTKCPENGASIAYALTIETTQKIMVEDIASECKFDAAHHEDVADKLHARFGGRQTMVASHHGFRITTIRGEL